MTTLTTLEIENPQTLTYVGKYAFNGCDKLTGFTSEAPLDLSGVTKLGEYASTAVSGCSMSSWAMAWPRSPSTPSTTLVCGISRSCQRNEHRRLRFANNNFSEAGELVLPERLEAIGSHAFYRNLATGATSGFTSITIPSTVKTIGEYAFYNHRRLETVTVDATAATVLNSPATPPSALAPTDRLLL